MLLLAHGYASIIHLKITLNLQFPCSAKESTQHVYIQSAHDTFHSCGGLIVTVCIKWLLLLA